jgi:hypothetical protein
MSMDPAGLGLDPGQDITPQITMPAPGEEDVSEGVENDLLSLLEQGGQTTILIISGERQDATGSRRASVGQFAYRYAQAARTNPALRWYGKLAALLPPEKFGVHQGSLRISMPAPLFRRVIKPFIGEFRSQFAETSPIVAAVRNLYANIEGADLQAKQTALVNDQRRVNNTEATDFDPGATPFEDNMLPDSAGALADLGEGEDGLGGDEIVDSPDLSTATTRSTLSLTDLSHKAIADHLAEAGGDDNAIMERMMGEGFTRSRANEIMSMVKYKRLMAARLNKLAGWTYPPRPAPSREQAAERRKYVRAGLAGIEELTGWHWKNSKTRGNVWIIRTSCNKQP